VPIQRTSKAKTQGTLLFFHARIPNAYCEHSFFSLFYTPRLLLNGNKNMNQSTPRYYFKAIPRAFQKRHPHFRDVPTHIKQRASNINYIKSKVSHFDEISHSGVP
jgi:hypothetical protein